MKYLISDYKPARFFLPFYFFLKCRKKIMLMLHHMRKIYVVNIVLTTCQSCCSDGLRCLTMRLSVLKSDTNHSVVVLLTNSWFMLRMIAPLTLSTAKLFNLNFHPLEVVSRWRDPQLQVSENYSDLTKWRSTVFKSCWLMSHFFFNIFKMWYLMC